MLTKYEGKDFVAIASNECFAGRTKTFTDPWLYATIVNKLTFNEVTAGAGTDSYRLAPHTR